MGDREAAPPCWHCKGESKCDCTSCAVPDGKGQWISGQCVVCCRREILDRQRLAGGGSVDLSDLQPQARGAVLSALQKEKEHRFANKKLWNLYRLVVGDHITEKEEMMPKEGELGALWKRKSKKGTDYWLGTIDGKPVVVFVNSAKSSDKAPDFHVFLQKSQQSSGDQSESP